jgi:hypothetical protein
LKSLLIVFAALFLLIATPYVFDSIDNALTEEYTQSMAGVSTASGVYTANVTLGQAAYNNSATSITAIASNLTSDTPTPASYNSTSKVVLVSGLEGNTSRTLTLAYLIDNTDMEAGMIMFIHLLRWFYIFIIIGLTGGAIYAFFQT